MVSIDQSYEVCSRNDTSTSWVPAGMEYFFGVSGNTIALILLWINRKEHRWQSFYKLFTGLILTDFLGIFLVYPFVMKRYSSDFTWCYPTSLCQFTSFVFVNAHLSEAFIICAMSVDRFISLTPTENQSRRYTFALIGIWIAASFIALLHLMGVGQENLYFPGSWCYFDFVGNTTGNRVMSYIYALIGISILSVTSTINAVTIYRIWRDPDRLRYLEDTRRISGSLDSHVMIFISAVTVVFVILWTPLIVVVFLHAANIRNENNEVELWFLRMTVCNAIVDPWLYIVLRKESLEKIIYILRQCTGNPSQENEALIS